MDGAFLGIILYIPLIYDVASRLSPTIPPLFSWPVAVRKATRKGQKRRAAFTVTVLHLRFDGVGVVVVTWWAYQVHYLCLRLLRHLRFDLGVVNCCLSSGFRGVCEPQPSCC